MISCANIVTALTLKNGATLSRATHSNLVNPSLTLPVRHEPPLLDEIPIPPGLQPISVPEYVCLDSVRSALEKFDIKVPVNEIISAIREEESKLVVSERRHTICKRELSTIVASSPFQSNCHTSRPSSAGRSRIHS